MRWEINNIKLYFACGSVVIIVHMNVNPEPRFKFEFKIIKYYCIMLGIFCLLHLNWSLNLKT
jgi:desulfoferrodoxin (superoxide reductase-like protein)